MNKMNQSGLKNLSVMSRMEWIWSWNVGMATHDFSQKVFKVCNDYSWLFPHLSTLKMSLLHCYEYNLSVCVEKIVRLHPEELFLWLKWQIFLTFFQNIFQSCSPWKLFRFIVITLYMLFYNLILSPRRYFVPFWIGEFLFFGRFFKLSASFTRAQDKEDNTKNCYIFF